MAAGAFVVYTQALVEILGRGTVGIDLDGGNSPSQFWMTLHTSSYTPSRVNHTQWSDVSGTEVAATGGYTAGGKPLTVSLTLPGSPNDTIMWDCDDQSWTSSTITAKYAIIVFDADGTSTHATTDKLICYLDLDTSGGSVSTTNGTFAITINAAGIFQLTGNG